MIKRTNKPSHISQIKFEKHSQTMAYADELHAKKCNHDWKSTTTTYRMQPTGVICCKWCAHFLGLAPACFKRLKGLEEYCKF